MVKKKKHTVHSVCTTCVNSCKMYVEDIGDWSWCMPPEEFCEMYKTKGEDINKE